MRSAGFATLSMESWNSFSRAPKMLPISDSKLPKLLLLKKAPRPLLHKIRSAAGTRLGRETALSMYVPCPSVAPSSAAISQQLANTHTHAHNNYVSLSNISFCRDTDLNFGETFSMPRGQCCRQRLNQETLGISKRHQNDKMCICEAWKEPACQASCS